MMKIDNKSLMYCFIAFLIGFLFHSIMEFGFCGRSEGFRPAEDGSGPPPPEHASCQDLIDLGFPVDSVEVCEQMRQSGSALAQNNQPARNDLP